MLGVTPQCHSGGCSLESPVNAYNFDGTNDFLSGPSYSPEMDDFTISFWLNVPLWTGAGHRGIVRCTGGHNYQLSTNPGWFVGLIGVGSNSFPSSQWGIKMLIADTSGNRGSAYQSMAPSLGDTPFGDVPPWDAVGNWRHFAFSVDRTNGVILPYADGVLLNGNSGTADNELKDIANVTGPLTTTAPLWVGRDLRYMPMMIAHLRIHDKALAPDEIICDGGQEPATSLVRWYPMQDTDPATSVESVGGQNLTKNNITPATFHITA